MGLRQVITNEPFQIITIDCIDSLPQDPKGYRYLVSVIDQHTRYLELVLIEQANTQTLINAVQTHWYDRWSLPQAIITDGGRILASHS